MYLGDINWKTISVDEANEIFDKWIEENSTKKDQVVSSGDFTTIIEESLKKDRQDILKSIVPKAKSFSLESLSEESFRFYFKKSLLLAYSDNNTDELYDFVADVRSKEIEESNVLVSDFIIAFLYRARRFDVIEKLLENNIHYEKPIGRAEGFYYVEYGKRTWTNNDVSEWNEGCNHILLTGFLSSYALINAYSSSAKTSLFSCDSNNKIPDDIVEYILENNIIPSKELNFFIKSIVHYLRYYGNLDVLLQYLIKHIDKFNVQETAEAFLLEECYDKELFDILEQNGFNKGSIQDPVITNFNVRREKYRGMLQNLYLASFSKCEFTAHDLNNVAKIVQENPENKNLFPDGYIDFIFDNLVEKCVDYDGSLSNQRLNLKDESLFGLDSGFQLPIAIFFYALGKYDLVKGCIEKGFSLDFTDKGKKTLLLATIKAKDTEAIKKLIELGVNPNYMPEGKENDPSPLQEVIKLKDIELVNSMLKAGADTTYINSKGESVLLHLLKKKEFDSLSKSLIESGLEIDKEAQAYITKTKRLGHILEK